MKGKLYKLNRETGKMEAVGVGDLTFELPKMKSGEEFKPTKIFEGEINITLHEVELAPKDVLKMAFDAADEEAEELDRRQCLHRQEIIDQLRNHFLGE